MNKSQIVDNPHLTELLTLHQIPFKRNSHLKKLTSFQIGGTTEYFAEPETFDQCAALQKILNETKVPWFMLAGGSNVLISDEHYNGMVIKLNLSAEPEILKENDSELLVKASANARAPAFARNICSKGYTGLEFLTTIPGELGGSVIQNAGCYGSELKDVITSVTICKNGVVQNIPNEKCFFTYRNSVFKNDTACWVLAAEFCLPKGVQNEIDAKVNDYRERRISSQPKNRKSAGSVFKNPPGKKAWQLIEQAGLRGLKKGDAEISAEHCNFIVNNGNASAKDVLYLIQMTEQQVLQKTGIQLEREVVLLGNFI